MAVIFLNIDSEKLKRKDKKLFKLFSFSTVNPHSIPIVGFNSQ